MFTNVPGDARKNKYLSKPIGILHKNKSTTAPDKDHQQLKYYKKIRESTTMSLAKLNKILEADRHLTNDM